MPPHSFSDVVSESLVMRCGVCVCVKGFVCKRYVYE